MSGWLRCIVVSLFLTLGFSPAFPQKGDSTAPDSIRLQVQNMIAEGEDLFWESALPFVDSALHLFDSAGAICEQYFGIADTTCLNARNWLARCYYWRGDIEIADSLNAELLKVCEDSLGADHPITAFNSACAAFLAWIDGREGDAIPACLRAIRVLEKAPEYRSLYSEALNMLELFYYNQQNWPAYDSLYPVVLDVSSAVHGSESRQCVYLYGVRGLSYLIRGKIDEAEAMAHKAIDLMERIGGRNQMNYGHDVLARIYLRRGEFAKAEQLRRKQLRTEEEFMGPTNWHLAESIRNLVGVLRRTADSREVWQEMEELAARAQRMCSEGWFVRVGSLQDVLCVAYGINGKYDSCLMAFKDVIESRLRFTENSFLYASEQDKLQASRLHPTILSPFISFAALHPTREVQKSALQMILKGRARILDAVAAERRIAFCSEDETLSGLTASYASVSSEISNLFVASSSQAYNKRVDDSLTVLYKSLGRLETEMSARCAGFKREMEAKHVTVSDVAGALPQGGVLLEYFKYRPFKFQPVSYFDNYEAPVYGVFVLDASSNINFVRLGEAKLIDSLVAECRENIEGASKRVYSGGEMAAASELSKTTSELYNLVFAPVEGLIGNRDRLFICLDQQLHLIPFEILAIPDGRYMIEKYKISYLSSGRDLLNYREETTSFGRDAIVMADPDYDRAGTGEPTGPFAYVKRDSLQVESRGPADRSECLADLFIPIPATALEGQKVTQLLSGNANYNVKAYYHESAVEQVLKRLDVSPRVLHIATHGYFCSKSLFSNARGLTENPLLYSGLALAGANQTIAHESTDSSARGNDDGILTSLEVSGLDLSETELVVLSSCNSGVGALKRDPEGMYGLRRAFQLAGARSIVTTMYSIPDRATVSLMTEFYGNWLSGKPKSEALRAAALSILNQRRDQLGFAHPVFWGGFVLVGDPN